MNKIANSMVDTVGNTPLIKLNKLTEGLQADVYVKAEFFNPLFSVKDRIGKAMIEDAEKKGILKPAQRATAVFLQCLRLCQWSVEYFLEC